MQSQQMKIDIESGLTPAFVAATLGTTGLCVGFFTQMKLPEKVVKSFRITETVKPE